MSADGFLKCSRNVVPALLARVCPFWHVGADRAWTAPVGDYRTCSCCCAHACMLIVRILVVLGAFFLRPPWSKTKIICPLSVAYVWCMYKRVIGRAIVRGNKKNPTTIGAQRWARTHDPEIKSLMLYRLSFFVLLQGESQEEGTQNNQNAHDKHASMRTTTRTCTIISNRRSPRAVRTNVPKRAHTCQKGRDNRNAVVEHENLMLSSLLDPLPQSARW